MIQTTGQSEREGRTGKLLFKMFMHGLIWLAFFSLPLLFRPRFGSEPHSGIFRLPMPLPMVVNNIFMVIAFYVNLLVLMPRFFNKKRWLYYALFTSLFILASFWLHDLSRGLEGLFGSSRPFNAYRPRPRGGFEFRQFSFLYTLGLIWAVSMVYHLLGQLQASRRHAEQVKASALQAELSFLKAQINPHFLFNTLNNIYALTLKQSEDAPKAVMKLSNLMRQFTDDTSVEFVPLDEELHFIRDYVELQQLRLSEKTTINCNLTESEKPLRIAPRLLIPFIDNAFKYGVSNRTVSSIDIDLHVEGNTLHFSVRNAIHANNAERQASSGIGLENVKRRLELLYEGRHTLTQEQTDAHYHLKLTLTLTP